MQFSQNFQNSILHVQFFVSYRFLSLIVILLYKQSTAVERSFYNFIVNLLFTYLHLFIPIAPLECFLVRTPSYVDRDAGRSPRRYDDPVNGGKPGR